jgi:hypothetical protein
MKMRKIVLTIVLLSQFFAKSAVGQSWTITGNSLSATGIIGSNSGDYDILFRRAGVQSGLLNSGSSETSFGVSALNASSTGSNNTAFGTSALAANTSGSNNATNGAYSLQVNTIGSYNAGNGYATLALNTTGSYNVANGFRVLRSNTTGSNNIGVGDSALITNTTGSFNIAIGNAADVSSATLTNAIAIGAYSSVGQSNSLVLGGTGSHAVKVGIGTATPAQVLDVVGNVKFSGTLMPNNAAGTSGQVLTSAGSGAPPTWTTPSVPAPGTSGYVLTSTGTGTTWAAPATAFSGTTNYISKFTPSGTAIGSSEIYDNGTFVGLNTTTAPTGYLFAVNGKAIFNKIVVEAYGNWADFVFQDNYKLPAITDVAKYIDQYQHLPGVPSESEVEKNGIDVGGNQKILLQKVEELTLYIIDENKQIKAQNKETAEQNKKIEELQNQNEQLQELKKEVGDLKAMLLQKSK